MNEQGQNLRRLVLPSLVAKSREGGTPPTNEAVETDPRCFVKSIS